MKDRTQTERQGRRRAKMRGSGWVRVEVWAHPDDRAEVVRHAEALRKAREKTG